MYHRGRLLFQNIKNWQKSWELLTGSALRDFRRIHFHWLSAGSLYVGTSSMEGFPNALVEAMSCRLPAVFSNCMSGPAEILSDRFGGVVGKQEVLRERYGILIPVMDDQKNLDPNEITEEEKQLAALLEELLTEEAKLQELSRCAKERADQFDDRAYRRQNPADCRAFQNVIHYGGTDKMRILQSRILFAVRKTGETFRMQRICISFKQPAAGRGGARGE